MAWLFLGLDAVLRHCLCITPHAWDYCAVCRHSSPKQAGIPEPSPFPCYDAQNKCLGTTENSNKPTVFAFKELGGSRDTLTDVSSHSHIFHMTDPQTSSCRVREGEQWQHLCLGLVSYLFGSGLVVFQAPLLLDCNLCSVGFYTCIYVAQKWSLLSCIRIYVQLSYITIRRWAAFFSSYS